MPHNDTPALSNEQNTDKLKSELEGKKRQLVEQGKLLQRKEAIILQLKNELSEQQTITKSAEDKLEALTPEINRYQDLLNKLAIPESPQSGHEVFQDTLQQAIAPIRKGVETLLSYTGYRQQSGESAPQPPVRKEEVASQQSSPRMDSPKSPR